MALLSLVLSIGAMVLIVILNWSSSGASFRSEIPSWLITLVDIVAIIGLVASIIAVEASVIASYQGRKSADG